MLLDSCRLVVVRATQELGFGQDLIPNAGPLTHMPPFRYEIHV